MEADFTGRMFSARPLELYTSGRHPRDVAERSHNPRVTKDAAECTIVIVDVRAQP